MACNFTSTMRGPLQACILGYSIDHGHEGRGLMAAALVHIAFGLSLDRIGRPAPRFRALASRCLAGASVLIPAGFFLGGVITHAGDPSLAVLLVRLGAALLIAAITLTALGEKTG